MLRNIDPWILMILLVRDITHTKKRYTIGHKSSTSLTY